jgi:hypothetical protein
MRLWNGLHHEESTPKNERQSNRDIKKRRMLVKSRQSRNQHANKTIESMQKAGERRECSVCFLSARILRQINERDWKTTTQDNAPAKPPWKLIYLEYDTNAQTARQCQQTKHLCTHKAKQTVFYLLRKLIYVKKTHEKSIKKKLSRTVCYPGRCLGKTY